MITNLEHKLEYYRRLDESSSRRYLGLLALNLGWHGIKEVSESFVVSMPTPFAKANKKFNNFTKIQRAIMILEKQEVLEKKVN